MPAIKNKKSEKFAQSIAAGADAETAMRRAGYAPDRRNAPRMRRRPDIAARVLELVAVARTKQAATTAAAPAPPDRAEVSDPFELAAWRAHDAAAAIGDQRGARAALALLAKARTARPRKAVEGAEEVAPAPRHPWQPERLGLPADTPPTALGTLITLAMEGPDGVLRERAEDERAQRQDERMRESMDANLALYRERCAAWEVCADTPEGRAGVIATKRRGI